LSLSVAQPLRVVRVVSATQKLVFAANLNYQTAMAIPALLLASIARMGDQHRKHPTSSVPPILDRMAFVAKTF
jgi:hypothetical protein